VRAIDWQNGTFQFPELTSSGGSGTKMALEDDAPSTTRVTLVAGAYRANDDREPRWVQVAPPVFGDLDGDRRDEALIHVRAARDNAPLVTFIQIYSADGRGHAVLRGTIYGGDRGTNALRKAIQIDGRGRVHVERYDTLNEDETCAPQCGWRQTWLLRGDEVVEDETARQRVTLPAEP
jgi:hypothetical protein